MSMKVRAVARRRQASASRVVGVEVDAGRVRAVVLNEGAFATALEGHGATPGAALRDVLTQAGRAASVRVALVADESISAPFILTTQLRARAAFTDEAFTRTGTSAAAFHPVGLFDADHLRSGGTAPGIAVALPRRVVDPLLEAAPAGAQVVPAVACMGDLEGLSLTLRDATAELVLVRGGHVRAHASLPAGGLGELDVSLGQGATVGATRLGAALRYRTQDHQLVDPEAVSALTRYMTQICGQVATLRNAWSLAGQDVPTSVYVYGRGSTFSALPVALEGAGLTLRRDDTLDGALSLIDPQERTQFAGAYLAARSFSRHRPQEAVVDARAVETALTDAQQVQRRRARRFLVTATATLVLTLAGPTGLAAIADARAHAALTSAITAEASAKGTSTAAVREALTRQVAAGVDPHTLAAAQAAATSANLTLTSAHLTVAGADLTFTGSTPPEVTIAALERSGLSVTSSSRGQGASTFTVTLTRPGGSR